MSQKDLEQRVSVLEEQMRRLISGKRAQPGPRDWLSSVGMFSHNSLMKEIDAAGQAIRARERQGARRRPAAKRRRAKS